jgi:hypothetical protein
MKDMSALSICKPRIIVRLEPQELKDLFGISSIVGLILGSAIIYSIIWLFVLISKWMLHSRKTLSGKEVK